MANIKIFGSTLGERVFIAMLIILFVGLINTLYGIYKGIDIFLFGLICLVFVALIFFNIRRQLFINIATLLFLANAMLKVPGLLSGEMTMIQFFWSLFLLGGVAQASSIPVLKSLEKILPGHANVKSEPHINTEKPVDEKNDEREQERRLINLKSTKETMAKAGQSTEKIDKMIAGLEDAANPTTSGKMPEKPNKDGVYKTHPWIIPIIIISIAFIIGPVITQYKENQKLNPGAESTIPTTQSQQWQKFNSVQDQFSILMPTYPTYDSKENMPTDNPLLTYSLHSYIAKDSQAIYHVYKYFYSSPIDVSNPDKLLERYISTDSDLDKKIVSSQYSYMGNYRVLDLLVQIKDKRFKERIVLANQTPYLLIMEYIGQDYNDANYNKFINSFQLQ